MMENTADNKDIAKKLSFLDIAESINHGLQQSKQQKSGAKTDSEEIQQTSLISAINKEVLEELKKKQKLLIFKKGRKCILLFDKIALPPKYSLNKENDAIVLYKEKINKKALELGTHVLAFMIRSIESDTEYEYPISITPYVEITPQELADLIKKNIGIVTSMKLTVIATVCTHTMPNIRAINYLIKETKNEYSAKGETLESNIFEVTNRKIIPLYDPPRLIRAMRNNLMTMDLEYIMDGETMIAKWDHITEFYKKQKEKNILIIPEYNRDLVEQIKRSSVSSALRLFSHKIGSFMGNFANKNKKAPISLISEECDSTAQMLLFFDKLFDSFNGCLGEAKYQTHKRLLRALRRNSIHEATWKSSKEVITTMQFISRNGKNGTTPSIRKWLFTIENMMLLKKELFGVHSFSSVWMSQFNRDPLINFFSYVGRRKCNCIYDYDDDGEENPRCKAALSGSRSIFGEIKYKYVSGTYATEPHYLIKYD